MNRNLGIIIAFLILGCNSSHDKVIIAQNEGKVNSFGFLTRLEMDRNRTYILSFTPYDSLVYKKQFYSGKYQISNDTFYFEGNRIFKKAVLKNGYIEFLQNSFKISLIENRTSIHSEKQLQGQKDFTFFTYNSKYEYLFKKGTNVDLNENDIIKIRKIIQSVIKKESKQFIHYSNENEYYKQCISILNNKNEKEVWIQCLSKESLFSDDWDARIIDVCDGGDSNFTLKINLTTDEVSELYVNGYA